MGRSHGHHRADLVTVSGQVSRPPLGSSYCPLTVALDRGGGVAERPGQDRDRRQLGQLGLIYAAKVASARPFEFAALGGSRYQSPAGLIYGRGSTPSSARSNRPSSELLARTEDASAQVRPRFAALAGAMARGQTQSHRTLPHKTMTCTQLLGGWFVLWWGQVGGGVPGSGLMGGDGGSKRGR